MKMFLHFYYALQYLPRAYIEKSNKIPLGRWNHTSIPSHFYSDMSNYDHHYGVQEKKIKKKKILFKK